MKPNVLAAVAALVLILSGIAAIFWQQELQYVRPTPVPANYVPVAVGEKVSVAHAGIPKSRKPVLLHFFNPGCPCSRFNLKHFIRLVKHYRNEIIFLAVVPGSFARQASQIRRKFDLDIPVIADEEKALAQACGVYATPQAALIDGSGKLYYRGNYNKSRYCTTKNSNYAQMAIDSLLAGRAAATFGEPATSAYGCELPEQGDEGMALGAWSTELGVWGMEQSRPLLHALCPPPLARKCVIFGNRLPQFMQNTDVCIVGAGPGGATAALHLANRGIPCTLIDKAFFPRDKVCGDALSGKVVNELKRIDEALPGRLERMSVSLPSWGIHFVAPDGHPLRIPFRTGYDAQSDPAPGYIARRVDFDDFLVSQARQRPEITLLEGVNVKTFSFADGYWSLADDAGRVRVRCRLLVAANGAQSSFSRKTAGLDILPAHHCAGLRAYYRNVAGCSRENFIELHFLKPFLPGYFWIFPLPGGYANVGVGMLSSHISRGRINLREAMLNLIATHPALRSRFAEAELVGEIKGYGLPLGSRRRPISGDHFMLAGDAAHLIDPFSGEGISNAMISGRWAADQAAQCLRTGDFSARFLKGYDDAVYRRLGRELQLSYRMQQLLNFPWLFNAVARKAARNPAFADLLSCMFNDLDLRGRLKNPLFYLKLLLNY